MFIINCVYNHSINFLIYTNITNLNNYTIFLKNTIFLKIVSTGDTTNVGTFYLNFVKFKYYFLNNQYDYISENILYVYYCFDYYLLNKYLIFSYLNRGINTFIYLNYIVILLVLSYNTILIIRNVVYKKVEQF